MRAITLGLSSRRWRGKRRYFIRWRDPETGLRHSESCGTTSKKDACAVRDRRWAEINAGETKGSASATTISSLLRDVEEALRARNRSKATILLTQIALRHVLAAVGDMPVARLGQREAEAYLRAAASARSPATVRREVGNLRACWNRAVAAGWAKSNPWRNLEMPQHRPQPGRVMSAEQEAQMTEAAQAAGDAEMVAFVALGLETGGRPQEICALSWPDFDPEGATVRLWQAKTQGHRICYLTRETVQRLAAWRARSTTFSRIFGTDGSSCYATYARLLYRWGKYAASSPNTQGLTPYSMRRAYCTRLARLVHPGLLADLAGHTNVATTLRHYVRTTEEERRAAILKMRGVSA